MSDEWKVYRTETMWILAKSEGEVRKLLVELLGEGNEWVELEMKDISILETDMSKPCLMLMVDETMESVDMTDFPPGSVLSRGSDGKPIVTNSYQAFIGDSTEAIVIGCEPN